jgi:hypothetical protein
MQTITKNIDTNLDFLKATKIGIRRIMIKVVGIAGLSHNLGSMLPKPFFLSECIERIGRFNINKSELFLQSNSR